MVIPEQLTAACAGFLSGAGWDDDNGELADDMAQLAADMAAAYPVGTALRVRFDHADQDRTRMRLRAHSRLR